MPGPETTTPPQFGDSGNRLNNQPRTATEFLRLHPELPPMHFRLGCDVDTRDSSELSSTENDYGFLALSADAEVAEEVRNLFSKLSTPMERPCSPRDLELAVKENLSTSLARQIFWDIHSIVDYFDRVNKPFCSFVQVRFSDDIEKALCIDQMDDKIYAYSGNVTEYAATQEQLALAILKTKRARLIEMSGDNGMFDESQRIKFLEQLDKIDEFLASLRQQLEH